MKFEMVDRNGFWRRVVVLSIAECWLWTGGKDADGYGKVKTPTIAGKRFLLGVHRVSYFLAHGPFDTALCVCHRCDQPLCVNPAHLFLGTHADNVADRHAKGRDSSGAAHSAVLRARANVKHNPLRGAANPLAKLTDLKVQVARFLAGNTRLSQREIASLFGVSHIVIGKAIRGDTWSHVDSLPRRRRAARAKHQDLKPVAVAIHDM